MADSDPELAELVAAEREPRAAAAAADCAVQQHPALWVSDSDELPCEAIDVGTLAGRMNAAQGEGRAVAMRVRAPGLPG